MADNNKEKPAEGTPASPTPAAAHVATPAHDTHPVEAKVVEESQPVKMEVDTVDSLEKGAADDAKESVAAGDAEVKGATNGTGTVNGGKAAGQTSSGGAEANMVKVTGNAAEGTGTSLSGQVQTPQSTPRHVNGNGEASGQQNVTGPLATPMSQSQSRQSLGIQGQAVMNGIKRKRSNTVGLRGRPRPIYHFTSSSSEGEDVQPRITRKRRPAHQQLKEAPARSPSLNENVEGRYLLEANIGGASGAVELEFNNENASRASRDDFAADENLKAEVVKKIVAGITNDTLLKMKSEILKSTTKEWIAFSERLPTTASCLTALLLK